MQLRSGRKRLCGHWFRRQCEVLTERGDVVLERLPLTVDENAAQMQNTLGTIATLTHPRTIKAQPDEIAHCALDGSGTDVDVALA